jgi:hypothetical protein
MHSINFLEQKTLLRLVSESADRKATIIASLNILGRGSLAAVLSVTKQRP